MPSTPPSSHYKKIEKMFFNFPLAARRAPERMVYIYNYLLECCRLFYKSDCLKIDFRPIKLDLIIMEWQQISLFLYYFDDYALSGNR